MPEIDFESLRATLPAEPASVIDQIQARIAQSRQKLVVLDDDPTGTQTVHGVSVLTEWSVPTLRAELESEERVFFILTNSRSLPLEASQALHRELGANLKQAAALARQEFAIISRGDSTLRGHFPGELDALCEGLETGFDGIILAPYFREGGRFTIGDIHYVVSAGKALPAAETEFARDPAFGYSESNLRRWVQEKTGGRVSAEQVVSVSIDDLRGSRDLRHSPALPKLLALRDGQVCILNAASDGDIEHAALVLLEAEQQGKRFLYRTSASFVRARTGIARQPLLEAADLNSQGQNGGLVVVGSFVPKSTAQLAALRKAFPFFEVEMNVVDLLDDARRSEMIAQKQQAINQALEAGQDVLLYTSRGLVMGGDAAESLQIGSLVSESLVALVRGLSARPRYLVGKGGITSSDVATKGLAVRRARVLGQVLPGVPVWQIGPESRYPGMIYVVFPGNVGDENALADVVKKFRRD